MVSGRGPYLQHDGEIMILLRPIPSFWSIFPKILDYIKSALSVYHLRLIWISNLIFFPFCIITAFLSHI